MPKAKDYTMHCVAAFSALVGRLSSVVAISVICFLSVAFAEENVSQVQVIANLEQEEDLSLRELRSIFSMKKTVWQDGTPISVYVLDDGHPLHRDFTKKRLNVFPNQLSSMWYRQVYTGTGVAPITADSEAHMIKNIKQTPGAIGYIYNKNIEKIIENENVRILKIH